MIDANQSHDDLPDEEIAVIGLAMSRMLDKQWFKDHPGATLLLRHEIHGEFGGKEKKPRRYVLAIIINDEVRIRVPTIYNDGKDEAPALRDEPGAADECRRLYAELMAATPGGELDLIDEFPTDFLDPGVSVPKYEAIAAEHHQ